MVRLRSPAPMSCNFIMGDFPSGQRGQTVNLLSTTSLVRIQHPPPQKRTPIWVSFFVLCVGDADSVCLSMLCIGIWFVLFQFAVATCEHKALKKLGFAENPALALFAHPSLGALGFLFTAESARKRAPC